MRSKIAQIRLVSSHPEVYEPCDDSFALVDALLADRKNLLDHRPTLCMEIGCGSGYVITSLALMLGQEAFSPYYIATDINPHAIRVTSETLKAHGVKADLVNTTIASGLDKRLEGLVDVMVINPPYVPTPEDEVGRGGIAAAWAGGENGRTVIDKMLHVADSLLSKRGWLYLVTLAANDPAGICIEMRKKGYDSRIIVQRSTEEESLHIIKFWRDFERISAKCFDARCGFVVTRRDLAPGLIYPPNVISVKGGKIFETKLRVQKDNEGNWWLSVGKNNPHTGFWPKEVLAGLSDSATYVDWGGEVSSPPSISAPPMGSGILPTKDIHKDAYIRWVTGIDINGYDFNVKTEPEKNDEKFIYNIFDIPSSDPVFGHTVYFGGGN